MQEMVADFERLPRVWRGLQPVLVPAVPSPVRCPGLHLPIPSAGCRPVSLLQ